MPSLDAFDEEFGRGPMANLHGQRRRKLQFSTIVVAVLGAAIITVLAWPWVSADRRLLSELQALLPISRNAASEKSAEEIDRLVREVTFLKKEIAELTEARQQAKDRIASLEQERRDYPATVYWYSDRAALTYQSPFPSQSRGVQTEGRPR
jgi:hypothetical protein